jgi:hypothetical protein
LLLAPETNLLCEFQPIGDIRNLKPEKMFFEEALLAGHMG